MIWLLLIKLKCNGFCLYWTLIANFWFLYRSFLGSTLPTTFLPFVKIHLLHQINSYVVLALCIYQHFSFFICIILSIFSFGVSIHFWAHSCYRPYYMNKAYLSQNSIFDTVILFVLKNTIKLWKMLKQGEIFFHQPKIYLEYKKSNIKSENAKFWLSNSYFWNREAKRLVLKPCPTIQIFSPSEMVDALYFFAFFFLGN